MESWLAFLTSIWRNLRSQCNLPQAVVSQVFLQLFNIINAQLFNYFIDTPKACVATKGCAVKMNISKLEQWALASADTSGLVNGVR